MKSDDLVVPGMSVRVCVCVRAVPYHIVHDNTIKKRSYHDINDIAA